MLWPQPRLKLLTAGDTISITRQAYLVGFVCAAVMPVAMTLDLATARYCFGEATPRMLHRMLIWSEVYAHGLGVAIIAAMVYVLDPANRRRLPRLLIAALGAGLAADVIKLFVARARPRYFDFESGVSGTFLGWLPVVNPVEGIGRFAHRLQSFPSAHAAVAMGLAVGLACLYPRGRYLFFTFGVLAAMQRIEAGEHFLSDACAGAALGLLFAATVWGSTRWNQRFAQFERAPSVATPS